jgi:uncharacterized protein
MKSNKYVCPKCGNRDYNSETISTTGGILSRIFNLQHKKFTALTCKRCTYTELYKTESSKIENVFDFITG